MPPCGTSPPCVIGESGASADSAVRHCPAHLLALAGEGIEFPSEGLPGSFALHDLAVLGEFISRRSTVHSVCGFSYERGIQFRVSGFHVHPAQSSLQ